jgi:opacity protein-like surface antigen
MVQQAGVEANITKKLLVSSGYVFANKGVNDYYQSDLTYGLGTHTFGIGGAYSILDNLQVNVGFGYTKYISNSRYIDHVLAANGQIFNPKESYAKQTTMVAIGLDFSF